MSSAVRDESAAWLDLAHMTGSRASDESPNDVTRVMALTPEQPKAHESLVCDPHAERQPTPTTDADDVDEAVDDFGNRFDSFAPATPACAGAWTQHTPNRHGAHTWRDDEIDTPLARRGDDVAPIAWEQLAIGKTIGAGAATTVKLAKLDGQDVVVKHIAPECVKDPERQEELENEIQVRAGHSARARCARMR